tara:strand:- start:1679 stop:2212 length:534 start_codon:yes stop_codon:yes gene_type:complete
MQKVIIGIDPGKGGGIAVTAGGKVIEFHKYPATMNDLYYIVDEILRDWNSKPIAYLEQVHAFPTDGRSSAFKFGTNYGLWQGLLLGFQIECKFVAPQVWMKPLGLPKDKKERKNRIKALAQNVIDKQNVPLENKRVTLHTSDAILISMYGFLKETVGDMSLDKKLEVYKIFKEKEKQ